MSHRGGLATAYYLVVQKGSGVRMHVLNEVLRGGLLPDEMAEKISKLMTAPCVRQFIKLYREFEAAGRLDELPPAKAFSLGRKVMKQLAKAEDLIAVEGCDLPLV